MRRKLLLTFVLSTLFASSELVCLPAMSVYASAHATNLTTSSTLGVRPVRPPQAVDMDNGMTLSFAHPVSPIAPIMPFMPF